MSDNMYEKQQPSAPPPYSPAADGAPQYGFHPPPQAYPQPQPQPGYPPQQFQPGYPQYVPSPQKTQSVTQQTVVVMGGCPTCRVGVLDDDYTCCGILCAICFFPIGILCCLAMKEKKCTNCGATF